MTRITYAYNNYSKFCTVNYDEFIEGIKKIKKMTAFQLQPIEVECSTNIGQIIENKRNKLSSENSNDINNNEEENNKNTYKIYSHQMVNINKINRALINNNQFLIRGGEIKTAIISNSKNLLNALDSTIIPLLGGAKISKIPLEKKKIPPQILYKQKDTAIIFVGNSILRNDNMFKYAVALGLSVAKKIIIIISGIRNGKAIICDHDVYNHIANKIMPKNQDNNYTVITSYDVLTKKQLKIFTDILLNPIFHYFDYDALENYSTKV